MAIITKDGVERKGYMEWVEVCRQYGLLCKRASILADTSSRLRLLSSRFNRLECLVCAKMDREWGSLLGTLGLAAAASSMINSFGDIEFCRIR